MCKFLCGHMFFFLFSKYLGAEFLGNMVNLLSFGGTFRLFYIIYMPTNNERGFQFLHTLYKFCYHLSFLLEPPWFN